MMDKLVKVLGITIILTMASPVFVWTGCHFLVGYGKYTIWIYQALTALTK